MTAAPPQGVPLDSVEHAVAQLDLVRAAVTVEPRS